jgi:transposase
MEWKGESGMTYKEKQYIQGHDDKIAEEKVKQILEAIEDRDREKLKELFSEKALREAVDLDKRMVFCLIHSKVQ